MTPRAAVTGLAGPRLLPEEAATLRRTPPSGVILFRRNVEEPAQLAALVSEVRGLLGEAAPVLVDQEGGRVARLRPPLWPGHPPAARYEGEPAARAAAHAALLGAACAAAGLDVVCAPVLDLRRPGAHAVIGDRAFSSDAAEVARLGAAWVEGLTAAGCVPVVKHVPGHGRATLDSHEALPTVEGDLSEDLAPFRALLTPGGGRHLWAMTAHVLYPAFDPDRPATLSPRILRGLLREAMGFEGVILSDDLCMGALGGLSGDLAAEALGAGCDLVLHCGGDPEETAALLRGCPPLSEAAAARTAAARAAALSARPAAWAAAAEAPAAALPERHPLVGA